MHNTPGTETDNALNLSTHITHTDLVRINLLRLLLGSLKKRNRCCHNSLMDRYPVSLDLSTHLHLERRIVRAGVVYGNLGQGQPGHDLLLELRIWVWSGGRR